jgi:hypothetical protein
MAKTLKKRKRSKIKKRKQSHKQSHKQPRRTRQRTNKKTRGRRLRKSRKMRGGVRGASQDLVSDSPYALWQEPAVETDAGAVSGGESPFDFLNNPQPAPTAAVAPATQPAPVQTPVAPATQPAPVQTPVAPATQSSPVQQPQPAVQPVEASGPPAVQQVVQEPQEPQVQSTVQVVQQQVQTGQLTRQQAQRARRKKAVDLMALTQAAVIDAGHGEAEAVRERAAAATAAATAAAAAAAAKVKPVAEGAAKLAGVGIGAYGAMAAAPSLFGLAAAAAPLALSAVPVAAGLAGVGVGGVAGKFAVNKTMQLGKLAKKYGDKKTLIWAIKVLAKEGWQFTLPDKTVATSDKLDLALGWIEKNYKSAKEVKPDQPRLDGTPTPVSP